MNLYWGELHTHTFCVSPESFASLEEATATAQSHLDFFALAERGWPVKEVVRDHEQARNRTQEQLCGLSCGV